MSLRIQVYSPDVEIGRELAAALHAEAPQLDVRVESRYPTERELEAADQTGLGAVVVGLTSGREGLQTIRGFRTTAPEIPTVAVGQAEAPEMLLNAMRAGATDYLWPPFGGENLANLLSSLPYRPRRSQGNRLFCFVPGQATDGASTIALHVAHALPTLSEVSPLLLDCDIHSSTLAFRLGTKFDFHLSDALERFADLDDIWKRVAAEWKGFRVLACPLEGEPPSEALRRRLPSVVLSATGAYETVIADLPPSFSPTIGEIARAAERLYLVCTPQLVSIHLARRRLDELKSLGMDRSNIRLLINRADSKNAVPRSTIESALGMPIDFSLPNDFSAVNQAAMKGGLVAPDTSLYKSLSELTRHIFGIEPDEAMKAAGWKRFLHIG